MNTQAAVCLTALLTVCMTTVYAQKGNQPSPRIQKPRITDTVRANVYPDNWFKLTINGNLMAGDSISFIPHNVISVDLLPEDLMTIAVMAKDNADPDTGMEYDNTRIGDEGFIRKGSDGTVKKAHDDARPSTPGKRNRGKL